jgi:hypothetical protein
VIPKCSEDVRDKVLLKQLTAPPPLPPPHDVRGQALLKQLRKRVRGGPISTLAGYDDQKPASGQVEPLSTSSLHLITVVITKGSAHLDAAGQALEQRLMLATVLLETTLGSDDLYVGVFPPKHKQRAPYGSVHRARPSGPTGVKMLVHFWNKKLHFERTGIRPWPPGTFKRP